MRRPALIVVALALALALVGCGSPQASPSPSTAGPTAEPSAAVAGLPTTCRDLHLRSPNGQPVDLSGSWLGNDGAHWLFTQIGDCLWATTTDKYSTPSNPDVYWQIYLRGTLSADFTIPVEYAYSSLGRVIGPHYGHAVLGIAFADDGGTDAMTLTKIAGCTGSGAPPCPAGEGTLQTTVWTLVDPSPVLPLPLEE